MRIMEGSVQMVYVRKNNIRQFVNDLGLKESERHRGDCPECRGRNTFTATNNMGDIKYNCFKLGCTVGGIYGTDMTAAEIHRYREQQQLQRAYTNVKKEKDTMEIPEYVVTPKASHTKYQRYTRRWGIAIGHTMYDVKDERVVFPIKHDGRIVDAVGRALYKNKKPKWYRYGNSGYPFIHGNSDTAIIVEDVVSALTLSKFCTGIALLGTNLLQSHIDVLKKYKKVGIALDKDASKKAVKILDDLALNMNAKFLLLEEDIKEMLDEDIKKLVDKVNNKAWGWMNDTY